MPFTCHYLLLWLGHYSFPPSLPSTPLYLFKEVMRPTFSGYKGHMYFFPYSIWLLSLKYINLLSVSSIPSAGRDNNCKNNFTEQWEERNVASSCQQDSHFGGSGNLWPALNCPLLIFCWWHFSWSMPTGLANWLSASESSPSNKWKLQTGSLRTWPCMDFCMDTIITFFSVPNRPFLSKKFHYSGWGYFKFGMLWPLLLLLYH